MVGAWRVFAGRQGGHAEMGGAAPLSPLGYLGNGEGAAVTEQLCIAA